MGKASVHRLYYPNAKEGQDPREVRPLAKADAVISTRGVKLSFMSSEANLTPDELQMYARWLYALSHEAREVGASGFISESQAYNTETQTVVPAQSVK